MSNAVASIDHGYVERHGVLARYRAGQLPPAESDAFEIHYLDCEKCRSQLEEDDALAVGFKTAAAEGLLRTEANQRSMRRWLAPYAIAASLLVMVLGALLVRRPDPGSAEPSMQAQIVPLLTVRDASQPAEVTVSITDRPEVVVFIIDAVQPELTAYDVMVSDAANRVLWSARDLSVRRTLGADRLAVAVPSAKLASGRLELAVIGRIANGSTEHRTTFRLQVTRAGDSSPAERPR